MYINPPGWNTSTVAPVQALKDGKAESNTNYKKNVVMKERRRMEGKDFAIPQEIYLSLYVNVL